MTDHDTARGWPQAAELAGEYGLDFLPGPSLLSDSSLLFAVSMGAFGTAFALTGTSVKILPMVIYTQVSDMSTDIAQADALAVILTLVTTGVIVLYERFFRPAGT